MTPGAPELAMLGAPGAASPLREVPKPSEWLIPGIDPSATGFNISSLVRHWAQAQPDVVAAAEADGRGKRGQPRFQSMSYASLDARIDAIGHALAHRGVKAGWRVGMFIPGPIDFLSCCFALQRLGAVPVLIDPGMGVKSLVACAEEQKLRAFIGVPKAHLLRTAFPRAFSDVEVAVRVGGGWFPGVPHLDDLVARLPADLHTEPLQLHRPEADAPATLVYTSGSTGLPKGVVYTHRMMAGQVAGVAHVGGFSPAEAHVACFPGFGLYAVGIGMTTVFPAMDFTKPAKADPRRILEALDAFGAQSAFGSPALWETFSQYVVEHGTELPRIRALFASGAAVQPALLRRLLPALPRGDVFTPYGATEALPVAYIGGRQVLAKTAPQTDEGAGTCVGQIAPDTDVLIIPITDAPLATLEEVDPLPAGEIGEICVAGPQVTEVYDQRPKHTAAAKVQGSDGRVWHRMGDVGYLDDEGRLWFCGRKSHRVQTAEGSLFSVPCEAIFETHPRVFRAALTWLGERPGQTPVMCVELTPGERATAQLIRELRLIGQGSVVTEGIEHLLVHPGFPVDRRHNAKIEREKLAGWAAEQLGDLAERAPKKARA